MAEPVDMILPLLREMRAEMSAGFASIDAKFGVIEKRLERMDDTLVTFRHALSADSLLSKIVTGEFEERLGFLERRLSDLESQK
ncbi:MAG TPA: hypothetical protein VGC77_02190 [Rhodopseudomonas sp.]|uniref:hypothetical protein n=1 Tax=Rhodopseudomonas sp. TaxID=1078 RepID=UPI002EDAF890